MAAPDVLSDVALMSPIVENDPALISAVIDKDLAEIAPVADTLVAAIPAVTSIELAVTTPDALRCCAEIAAEVLMPLLNTPNNPTVNDPVVLKLPATTPFVTCKLAPVNEPILVRPAALKMPVTCIDPPTVAAPIELNEPTATRLVKVASLAVSSPLALSEPA